MLELKALLLTQGMHGMVSQTEGLAKALKLNFKHQKIRLKPLWNLIPPNFTPISDRTSSALFSITSKASSLSISKFGIFLSIYLENSIC